MGRAAARQPTAPRGASDPEMMRTVACSLWGWGGHPGGGRRLPPATARLLRSAPSGAFRTRRGRPAQGGLVLRGPRSRCLSRRLPLDTCSGPACLWGPRHS